MLSPMPQKAFDAEVGVPEVGPNRPDDVNEEATKDLRMALETPTKQWTDRTPTVAFRCSSAASTNEPCSTSETSPHPPSFSCTSSPDLAFCLPADLGDSFESSMSAQKPQRPPGVLDKSSCLLSRKLFVGGIPQSIDQNALFHMFSKFGKVKQAWIQLSREGDEASNGKEHRGFGFVIYAERRAVDEMLGEDFARFVTFRDGLKLEVRHATPKTNEQPSNGRMQEQSRSRPTPGSSQARPNASPAAPQARQAEIARRRTPLRVAECLSPAASQSFQPEVAALSPAASQYRNGGSLAPSQTHAYSPASTQTRQPEVPHHGASLAPLQAWQNCSTQNWQGSPCQTVLVGFVPCVPVLVCVPPPLAQWRLGNTAPWPASNAHTQPSMPTAGSQATCQFPVSQAPTNRQQMELAHALSEAKPEFYEE